MSEHDRRGGDAAAGTLHQNVIAFAQAGAREQHAICREVCSGEATCLLPRQRRGFGNEVSRRYNDVFGVRSADPSLAE